MNVSTLRCDGCLGFILSANGEAVIIDPTRDVAKYREQLAREGAELRFVIDTHTHADHLSGARKLCDDTGARLVMSGQSPEQWRAAAGKADALGIGDVLRANAGVRIDHPVRDGDTIEVGGEGITFVTAPGHTLDSLVVLAGARAFTGDTLHIGQAGRCDLPGGSGGDLYDTLFTRLASLPDETFVYPGHDYQGQTLTALGLERASNRFFARRSRSEFEKFLAGAFPTLTGAGMQCGAAVAGGVAGADCAPGSAPADPLRDRVAGFMDARFFGGNDPRDVLSIRTLAQELAEGAPLLVLDVREPSEFVDGHIDGAQNLSVREIDARLGEIGVARDARIVTVCKSGRRSGWAAMFLRVAGFTEVRSLDGGMMAWRAEGLPAAIGAKR